MCIAVFIGPGCGISLKTPADPVLVHFHTARNKWIGGEEWKSKNQLRNDRGCIMSWR